MKAHTTFTVKIGGKHPALLLGRSKSDPGTFAFNREVIKVVHSWPFKGNVRVDWSRHDGTGEPPEIGEVWRIHNH